MTSKHRGSVLPRIDVERTKEGVLLRASRPGAAYVRELVLYGIAFLIFLAVAFVPRGGTLGQIARLLNAVGIFNLFLAMLTGFLRSRRIFKATILLRSWPLRLGDNVDATFRAMLRKGAQVTSLNAKLQCTEHVTIGHGREQTKRSSVVYELDLLCTSAPRRIVEESWSLPIAASLPASFVVPHNRVEWRVVATLTTEDVEIPAEFTLLVIPEVAS